MEKTGRRNQIEERHYNVWINPEMNDDYQIKNIGTVKGIASNSCRLEDSASAKLTSFGRVRKGVFHQGIYISPGIVVDMLFGEKRGDKLRKVICTGHPEDHQASKDILEKLVGADYKLNRIKLNYSHTQPI